MDSKLANSRLIRALRSQVADLAGRDADEIEPDTTFTDLGFDSLFLTQLGQDMRRAFGVKVTFRQLMEGHPTIRALATLLVSTRPELGGDDDAPAVESATSATAPGSASAGAGMDVPARAAPGGALSEGAHARVEAIVKRQLELMNQQLEILRGMAAVGVRGRSEARAPELSPSTATPPVPPATPPVPTAAPPTPPAAPPPTETSAPRPTGAVIGNPGSPTSGAGAAAPVKRPGDTRPAHIGAWSDLDPPRRAALESLVERYQARTRGSKEHVQRHRAAHADPRTAAGFHKVWKEIVYPLVVTRSSGSKLWDIDGNEYIDLLNGFGPNFLGHAHARVALALEAQLGRGIEVGPQTPLAGETAALVCELTGMERASFMCTGSEAVQAAIRCARTFTGRDKLILFAGDYHGNFDEVLVRAANTPGRLRTVPSAPGIPRRAVDDVIVLPYALDETLATIEALGDQVAAVLVEPVQSRRPDLQPREFLHALRRVTEKNGTLLIFDEVVTGFRCHQGGAQAHFGVRADLATYGKVVGGNMPIGIVAGRRAVMDTFDGGHWQYGDDSHPTAGVTFFAGTFVRNPLSIASCHAMLSFLKEAGPGLQEQLNARAASFAARVNAIFQEVEAPVELPHFASIMFLRNRDTSELGSLLWHHLRLHGVHAQEGFPSYLTLAHTDEDLDRVVEAFRASVTQMIEAGFYPPARRRLKATPPAPGVAPTPPVKGARLGRDPQGRPAWYIPDPEHPGRHVRVSDTATKD